MTDFEEAWDEAAPEISAALGGVTVRLTRPSSLTARSALSAVGAFQVAADAALGAGAVTLSLAGGGTLGGFLAAGTSLTIAGHIYTVGADVTPTPGSGILPAVQISPGLAAAAPAGTPVAIDPRLSFIFQGVLISQQRGLPVAGQLQPDVATILSFPRLGAPTRPRLNDEVALPDGTVGRIASAPPSTGGWWDCDLGYGKGA